MTLSITSACVKCDMCVFKCPNQAIFLDKKNNHYQINKKKCTECIGFYNSPICKRICPIKKAIIKKLI